MTTTDTSRSRRARWIALTGWGVAVALAVPVRGQTSAASRAAIAADPPTAAAVADAKSGWFTDALKTRDQRLAWWRDARFGCFIHWGVYAGPAGVWERPG
jgi:hypothetical protein